MASWSTRPLPMASLWVYHGKQSPWTLLIRSSGTRCVDSQGWCRLCTRRGVVHDRVLIDHRPIVDHTRNALQHRSVRSYQ